MRVRFHFSRYQVCSLVLLVVLWGTGGRVLASAQQEAAPAEARAPAVEPAQPSEHGAAAAPEHRESGGHAPGPWTPVFQWINFALIVGGIVYASKKMIGPLLNARARAIQEDLAQSARVIEDANRRLGDVESKLQRLGEEIRTLRQSAFQETEAERARIEQQAQADAQKIVRVAEQEIAAAAKAARQELKVYAADLAVSLAEKKVQASMSPQSERVLFQSFVQGLGHQGGGN